jgi:hypothetical protein
VLVLLFVLLKGLCDASHYERGIFVNPICVCVRVCARLSSFRGVVALLCRVQLFFPPDNCVGVIPHHLSAIAAFLHH